MKVLKSLTALVVTICIAAGPAKSADVGGRWLLTFDIGGIGVLETVVDFEGQRQLRGASVSRAPLAHADIFPMTEPEPFIRIKLGPPSKGKRSGRMQTVFGAAELSVTLENGVLSGTFKGEVNGDVSGRPFNGDLPLRAYDAVLDAIDTYTAQWLYDLRFMKTGEWKTFHDRLEKATAAAQDDFDMVAGFRRAWGDGLFSHYDLTRPLKSLDQLIKEADVTAEETPVVRVEFTDDDIAVMTIDSFFGARIEQQIDQAFQKVIEVNPVALVIDVRENAGGTLAAWPVAARLLQSEQIGGYFIANRWWAEHEVLPTTEFLRSTPSPAEVTPGAFQKDLFSDGVLVMRIAPAATIYEGPAYALISPGSRSATEALIGVLKYLGRVQTVGETSAGYMLNSNLFQIAEGFTLRIPIADFYLPSHKSLEAVGVAPDIPVDSKNAVKAAFEQIRSRRASK